MLFRWKMKDSPRCECGADRQTMGHIISDCPLFRYDGDLTDILEASPNAIRWLTNLNI